jgi:SSS family solute:Na+ symporter
MACLLYVPTSLLFFFIGSGLFAYYEAQPERRAALVAEATALSGSGDAAIADRVLPHFIATELPVGVSGLIVAALFAAAMSSIDTSLNSSATVVLSDLYRAYVEPDPGERRSMRVLEVATVAVGALGTAAAVAMIGVGSLLDAWWTLSGIFAGGMLGLFLLGFVSRADRVSALAAVGAGLAVILWMTFSPRLPPGSPLRSTLHANLIIVAGTLSILLVGWLASGLRARDPAARLAVESGALGTGKTERKVK